MHRVRSLADAGTHGHRAQNRDSRGRRDWRGVAGYLVSAIQRLAATGSDWQRLAATGSDWQRLAATGSAMITNVFVVVKAFRWDDAKKSS